MKKFNNLFAPPRRRLAVFSLLVCLIAGTACDNAASPNNTGNNGGGTYDRNETDPNKSWDGTDIPSGDAIGSVTVSNMPDVYQAYVCTDSSTAGENMSSIGYRKSAAVFTLYHMESKSFNQNGNYFVILIIVKTPADADVGSSENAKYYYKPNVQFSGGNATVNYAQMTQFYPSY
jgi:hypothetical protein